jgi:type I restriction enzyme S subunit
MVKLTNMPRYDHYKESGEGWIDKVPKHWDVKKLKRIFSEKKHTRNISLNCGSISFGKVVTKDDDKILHSTKASYQEVLRGQFLINPLNLNYDLISLRIALSEIDVVVSAGYIVLKNKVELNKEYFKYLLHRYDVAYMKLLGSGVRQTINFNHIANSLLLQPPMAEQTAIANFLDKKTAKIDEAIAIKQKQIELLKERKQITIQQAVTQGLNPNAPMKDSGVDWIGETPKHWNIIRLKHLFNEHTRRTQTGVETLFSLRMELGLVPHDDVSDKHIPNEDLIDYKIVTEGQLVMNRMRAAIGIFGISKAYGLVSPDYAVFDISEEVVSEYYLTLFKLPLIGTQFRLASKGMGTGSSGFMRLYTDSFGNIKMPNPPKEEQKELMAFIDKENESISKAIHLLQTQIDKLKEYKTTLISSAVTGKIRVI